MIHDYEQELYDLRREHQWALKDLQRAHQQNLIDLRESYQQEEARLQRLIKGLPVPGFCQSCKRDFSSFHQWQDYEQCPRCGADLEK